MKRLSDWCGDNFSGGRITELSVYKGDTYKLELEGGQTFFINCAIVADYDLHEGGEMDAELLEKLQHADKMRKAKKRALYLLGSRMYSYNELYKKLLPTYGEEASRAAADAMREYGYIDDADYAEKLAEKLIHGKHYGMSKTRWEMQSRGLDKNLIEDILAEYTDDVKCIPFCWFGFCRLAGYQMQWYLPLYDSRGLGCTRRFRHRVRQKLVHPYQLPL